MNQYWTANLTSLREVEVLLGASIPFNSEKLASRISEEALPSLEPSDAEFTRTPSFDYERQYSGNYDTCGEFEEAFNALQDAIPAVSNSSIPHQELKKYFAHVVSTYVPLAVQYSLFYSGGNSHLGSIINQLTKADLLDAEMLETLLQACLSPNIEKRACDTEESIKREQFVLLGSLFRTRNQSENTYKKIAINPTQAEDLQALLITAGMQSLQHCTDPAQCSSRPATNSYLPLHYWDACLSLLSRGEIDIRPGLLAAFGNAVDELFRSEHGYINSEIYHMSLNRRIMDNGELSGMIHALAEIHTKHSFSVSKDAWGNFPNWLNECVRLRDLVVLSAGLKASIQLGAPIENGKIIAEVNSGLEASVSDSELKAAHDSLICVGLLCLDAGFEVNRAALKERTLRALELGITIDFRQVPLLLSTGLVSPIELAHSLVKDNDSRNGRIMRLVVGQAPESIALFMDGLSAENRPDIHLVKAALLNGFTPENCEMLAQQIGKRLDAELELEF